MEDEENNYMKRLKVPDVSGILALAAQPVEAKRKEMGWMSAL